MSANRLRAHWVNLATRFNDDGALDENTMASLRYCFVAGLSVMQAMIFDSVTEDAPEGDTERLIKELDEVMGEIIEEQEHEQRLAAPVDGTAIQATDVVEGEPLSTANKTGCRGAGRKKES